MSFEIFLESILHGDCLLAVVRNKRREKKRKNRKTFCLQYYNKLLFTVLCAYNLNLYIIYCSVYVKEYYEKYFYLAKKKKKRRNNIIVYCNKIKRHQPYYRLFYTLLLYTCVFEIRLLLILYITFVCVH